MIPLCFTSYFDLYENIIDVQQPYGNPFPFVGDGAECTDIHGV
jgi:hypothetical protein